MPMINKIFLSLYTYNARTKKLQLKPFNGNVVQKRCVIVSMLYIHKKRDKYGTTTKIHYKSLIQHRSSFSDWSSMNLFVPSPRPTKAFQNL